MRTTIRWREHPARKELRQIFDEVDVLVRDASCGCAVATSAEDARCCQFAITGREPYVTPVELCEVDLGRRERGVAPERPRGRRSLPQAQPAACPLLSTAGRCTIYAARPFGCRTFFCAGHEPPRRTREAVQALGRRLSDLAARVFPRDSRTRPFTRALEGPTPALPDPRSGRPRGT